MPDKHSQSAPLLCALACAPGKPPPACLPLGLSVSACARAYPHSHRAGSSRMEENKVISELFIKSAEAKVGCWAGLLGWAAAGFSACYQPACLPPTPMLPLCACHCTRIFTVVPPHTAVPPHLYRRRPSQCRTMWR